MYFKKFFATASAIAIIVGSLGTMGVLANNCGDTSWTFTYATGGNMYATKDGRQKQDDSSSYMKCNSYSHIGNQGSGNSYYGTAHGAVSKESSYGNRMYNGKVSTRYMFTSGTTKYMTNYIYESSCRWANIYCESGYTSYATFSGVWSPDSV